LEFEFPKFVKTETRVPDVIQIEVIKNEIIPLFKWMFEKKYPKYTALLMFWFYTGLRNNEIVALKRADFDLENRTVRVRQSKTKSEKLSIFTDEVKNLLKEYWLIEPEINNAFNITMGGIAYMFRLIKQNFPEYKIYPYVMRSSFATNCLKNGVDLFTLQHLMGHTNIKTTTRYLKAEPTLLKSVYDKALNKKKGK
jgi:integrase/recombinase XerD